jgi:nanoRNase/pAp phosphatase (c-di-AMP/oligoRNAs hydrolase)
VSTEWASAASLVRFAAQSTASAMGRPVEPVARACAASLATGMMTDTNAFATSGTPAHALSLFKTVLHESGRPVESYDAFVHPRFPEAVNEILEHGLERVDVPTAAGHSPVLHLPVETVRHAVDALKTTVPDAAERDMIPWAMQQLDRAREEDGVASAALVLEQPDGSVRVSLRRDDAPNSFGAVRIAKALGTGGGKQGSAATIMKGVTVEQAMDQVGAALAADAASTLARDPFRGAVSGSR